MKMFFAVVSMVAVASFAQARPTAYNKTCAEAKDLVASANGIVMTYAVSPKAGALYDTFYADSFSCTGYDSQSEAAYITTTDTSSCFVGYTCTQRDGN